MASTNTDALRFKDKVAIVTGGCNGIGRGCVDVFVEHGGKVAVLDLDETVGNSLPTDGPGEMYFIQCDITDEEQLKNAIASTYERFGRIDCLVNNAGTHPGLSTIDNISTARFRKMIDLLLVSQFVSCREALPYLRKTKGSIVNITSMSGATCQVYCTDYCAAKSGLAGLTRGLACEEAKHGVRVNALTPLSTALVISQRSVHITMFSWLYHTSTYTTFLRSHRLLSHINQRIAPGPTRTPLMEQYLANCKDSKVIENSLKDSSHFRRFAETREVGLACLFLAVDATFTSGGEIYCSGGSDVGYGIKVDSFTNP